MSIGHIYGPIHFKGLFGRVYKNSIEYGVLVMLELVMVTFVSKRNAEISYADIIFY